MFSKTLCVALLSLSLSAFTAQGAPAQQQPQCNTVSTVFSTVTVTAAASTSTSKTGTNNGSGGGSGNNNQQGLGGKGQGNNGGGKDNNGSNGKSGTGNNVDTSGAQNGTGGKGGAEGGNKGSQSTSTDTAGGKGATATASADAAAGTKGAGGAAGGKGNGNDIQSSLTLDPSVIASGFANNGQNVPEAGQVASLTSTNNFINFCASVKQPITNGKQIATGSCNPAPIGIIPSSDNMPSAKFKFPPNFGTIQANKPFTIEMAINNLDAGFFVNAQSNYFAAPQVLNGQGLIQGHSHVVVEAISALDQTTTTDPKKFAFFKGLNNKAVGGALSADVTAGLPVGVYRLASINTAANHQPVIVPIAQHGSLDDAVYFTVTADGKPAAGAANAGAGGATNNAGAAGQAGAAGKANAAGNAGKADAAGSSTALAKGAAATASAAPAAASASSAAKGKGV